MKIEELVKPALDWSGGSWAGRVDQAASFLFLHGYIPASQRQRITNRIEKQFRDGIEAGAIMKVDP